MVCGLLKQERELVGSVWLVKTREGTSGKCVVCMGNGVEIRFVVSKWAMGMMRFNGT